MKTSESIEALRRANPRAGSLFTESVEVASRVARRRIALAGVGTAPGRRAARRTRLVGLSAASASLAAAAVVSAFLAFGSPGGTPGVVDDASAAIQKAAAVSAASAEQSGTAVDSHHP